MLTSSIVPFIQSPPLALAPIERGAVLEIYPIVVVFFQTVPSTLI
jgi:hypothetical protein